MNELWFKIWFNRFSGLSDAEFERVKREIENTADPDSLLREAISNYYSYKNLVDSGRLKSVATPEKVIEPEATPDVPVAKVKNAALLDELKNRLNSKKQTNLKPKAVLGQIFKKPSKKVMIIAGVVVLLAILLGVFVLSSAFKTPSEVSFDVAPGVPQNQFGVIVPTQTPIVIVNTVDSYVDSQQTVSEEAVAVKNIKEEKEKSSFQVRLPVSIPDLISNPDWNFIIFMLVLFVLVVLTKQERFAEQQQTDWRIIRIGYIFVLVGMVLTSLVTMFLNQVIFFLIGVHFVFDPLWIQIVLLGFGLVAFIAASITGKTDWTPVSVGLFVMGGLLYAFNPAGAGQTIGTAMVIAGIAVHIFELGTQQGTAGALGMVLVGLPLFVGLRFGFAALFGLIGTATLPIAGDIGAEIVRWLALTAYGSRVLWSTILALLIGFALANVVASAIFPPIAKMLPQSGQLVGNLVPTEDTPRTDAIVAFLMGVVSFWLIVGHF